MAKYNPVELPESIDEIRKTLEKYVGRQIRITDSHHAPSSSELILKNVEEDEYSGPMILDSKIREDLTFRPKISCLKKLEVLVS